MKPERKTGEIPMSTLTMSRYSGMSSRQTSVLPQPFVFPYISIKLLFNSYCQTVCNTIHYFNIDIPHYKNDISIFQWDVSSTVDRLYCCFHSYLYHNVIGILLLWHYGGHGQHFLKRLMTARQRFTKLNNHPLFFFFAICFLSLGKKT